MRIAVASDGRSDSLRRAVHDGLVAAGHEFVDRGVHHTGGIEAGLDAADAILTGLVERAIVISSSALGASFLANKIPGIHAGVCADTYDARRSAENGVNLVCLGLGSTPVEAVEIVRAFVGARALVHQVPPADAPARAVAAA